MSHWGGGILKYISIKKRKKSAVHGFVQRLELSRLRERSRFAHTHMSHAHVYVHVHMLQI